MVIKSGEDAALQRTSVDRFGVALGSNYEARFLGLEKPDGIRNEVRIETVTLENRNVRASTLEYSLLNCLAVAGPSDRKNPNLLREALLQPVAGLERVVSRSVLHKDDLSQNNALRKAIDKGLDKGLQIEYFVVDRDHDTVFH